MQILTPEELKEKNDDRDLVTAKTDEEMAVTVVDESKMVLPSNEIKSGQVEVFDDSEIIPMKIVMPPNVQFFREKLMEDIEASEKELVMKEEKDKPEVVLAAPVQAPIDSVKIVNVVRTGAEMGIDVGQTKSQLNNLESNTGGEGGTAMEILETYTPEQMRAKKAKKLVNVTLTIVVIAMIAAAGYYFGWPLLSDYMGGL